MSIHLRQAAYDRDLPHLQEILRHIDPTLIDEMGVIDTAPGLETHGSALHFVFVDNIGLREYSNLMGLSQRTHDIVNLLLERGCAVNAQNRRGMTPLHFLMEASSMQAEPHCREEIAQTLLQYGAKHNVKNKDNQLPLEVLKQHKGYDEKDLEYRSIAQIFADHSLVPTSIHKHKKCTLL